MALSLAVALLGLHLVDADLLALAILDDVAGNDCALNNGSSENGGLFVDDCKNLVKLNGFAGFDVELLYEDNVTLGNTVLLATGYDDCMLHLVAPAFLFADSLLRWKPHFT